MHLTSSPVAWYAARAAGIVAYVLLSAVVALGLTMSGRRRLARWPRFALEDVHRFGGILEYLASGATCRGIVTKIESYGFSARCRMPDGTSRSVHAQWQPANGSLLQGGEIRSSAQEGLANHP